MANLYLYPVHQVIAAALSNFFFFFFFVEKLHGSTSLFSNQLTRCVLSFSQKINNLIVTLKNLINNPKLHEVARTANSIFWFSFKVFLLHRTGVTYVLEVTRCTGSTRHLPIVPFYQLSAVFHVYCVKFVNEGFNLRLSLHAGNNSNFLPVDMKLLSPDN